MAMRAFPRTSPNRRERVLAGLLLLHLDADQVKGDGLAQVLDRVGRLGLLVQGERLGERHL
jgi:hypothetical protein